MRLLRVRVWAADERGDALIEAAVTMALVLAVGLGAFWVGNLVLRYYQLEKAVQTAARYGARSEYLPGGGPARRRTAAEIQQYTIGAADPVLLTPADVVITCGPLATALSACPNPELQPAGTFLHIKTSSVVASNDPVMAFARAANGLLHVLGVGSPFPTSVTITDSALSITE